MTDSDLMPFGRYIGEKLGDVPADYLLWFYDHPILSKTFPELAKYVSENLKALEAETRNKD